jgi:ABC-type uncharacterized transport system substrate-binding protein
MSNVKELAAQWGSKIKNLLSPQKEEKSVEAPHISSVGSALYRRSGHFHVAVMTISRAGITDEVLAGIRNELETHAPGQFTLSFFEAGMDEQKLLKQVTTVVRSHTMPYDAIVTIGAKASQVATRTALYLNTPIPIVFTSVVNPSHLGIIYPGKRPTRNITGIAIPDVPIDQQINTLRKVKKNIHQVLLPYNPNVPLCIHQKIEISNLFNCAGIAVNAIPIYSKEEVLPKISSQIYDADTIVTLRDATTVLNMGDIVKICGNYGVTLYTADLESVQLGAALGFASSDTSIGKETAQQLLILFQEDVSPHEIPVKDATMNYQLAINTKNIAKQGVSLDKNTLDSLENKILYGGGEPYDATEKNNTAH